MIQYQDEQITVFQSALYQTTSAVVETEEAIVMTDPNWLAEEVETIRAFVQKRIGDKQLYIIYTHSDYDHIIGAGAFPHATVIASEAFTHNSHKQEILEQIKDFDQKYYVERDYEVVYPNVDVVVTEDGQQLQLGSTHLTFYKAPGHTEDGVFTVIEPLGIFLSGDYLSDVEFPFIFDSYKNYVHTMKVAEELLSQHSITTHVPGHGTTTTNIQEIIQRLKESVDYLDRLNQNEHMETHLKKRYRFFEGMKEIHSHNIKMTEEG